MQAYAPLFTNVNKGARQFSTNLIGYDAAKSYGSPSYYVQLMFNSHRGDEILSSSPNVVTGLYTSVTRDSRTKTIFIKAANSSGVPRTVSIEIAGTRVAHDGKLVILSGNPEDTNSIENPRNVIPVEHALHVGPNFENTFPAYSVTVLEVHGGK